MNDRPKAPRDSDATRIEPGGDPGEGATQINTPAPGGSRPQAAADLGSDRLLRSLERSSHEGAEVPSIAGIHILRKLGQGGMGAVYLGWKPLLRRHVAVKVLPLHLAELQPQMVDRFIREAQIAASIESPHLVRVIDVGEVEGLFYIVMEYVEGGSAGSLLRGTAAGRLDEQEALDVCIAATRGLAAAHERGIIHRDIKPDNIMVPFDSAGLPMWSAAKLADLGLARSEELGQSLTGTQAGMGTPGYMAPEQAMSAHRARKPADVFGMGATLYALLTGRSPFEGESSAAAMLATLQQPHAPVRELTPAVSEATATLIDVTLAKEPDQRYPDAAAMLAALEACRSVMVVGTDQARQRVLDLRNAGETGDAVKSTPLPEATVVADRGVRAADPRRIRWIPVITALVVAALVAIAGWYLLRDSPTAAAAAPVELTILNSADSELWLPWAVEQFRRSAAGRDVAIKLHQISDRDAIERISSTTEPLDAWFPSGALADEELGEMMSGSRRAESSTLITLSPQVILLFRSRHDALVERFGAVNFAALEKAVEEGTWEAVAGQPDWGRVAIAMTDPTKHSSGIVSVLLLAAELDHRDRTVTLADLNQPGMIRALHAFDPALQMTGGAAEALREMVLRGPSAWDGIVVSEALAISHIPQLEGRWEEVRLVYPHVNYWNESRIFIVSDASRNSARREALESFTSFLLSEPVQSELVRRGLRPANPQVGIRSEGSPFMTHLDRGVKVEVPIALDPPAHEVVDAIYHGYWRK